MIGGFERRCRQPFRPLFHSRQHVAIVVPEPDHRLIAGMLVAQDAERRSAQEQEPAVGRGQPEPASAQDPEEVAVSKEENGADDRPQAGYDAIGPGTDCLDRLAPRTTIAEEVPTGPLVADVGRRPALVLAVVPFPQ